MHDEDSPNPTQRLVLLQAGQIAALELTIETLAIALAAADKSLLTNWQSSLFRLAHMKQAELDENSLPGFEVKIAHVGQLLGALANHG